MEDKENDEPNEEQKKIIETIDNTLVQIKMNLDTAFNQAGPLKNPKNIADMADEWQKVRQAINNKNIGLLLGFEFTITSFQLSAEKNKNFGQENLTEPNAPPPDNAPLSDEKFLKMLGLRPPS